MVGSDLVHGPLSAKQKAALLVRAADRLGFNEGDLFRESELLEVRHRERGMVSDKHRHIGIIGINGMLTFVHMARYEHEYTRECPPPLLVGLLCIGMV